MVCQSSPGFPTAQGWSPGQYSSFLFTEPVVWGKKTELELTHPRGAHPAAADPKNILRFPGAFLFCPRGREGAAALLCDGSRWNRMRLPGRVRVMKVPGKGGGGEPGPGDTDSPVLSPKVPPGHAVGPASGPFPKRAAEVGVAASQGRGVRAPPTASAPAPAPSEPQSSCAPPARFARPCAGFVPSSLGPTEPRRVPAGQKGPHGPGHAPPKRSAGSAAGSGPVPPRGRPSPSGGRRETIPGSRACLPPAGAREGGEWARILCPVRPWVGIPEGLRSGAGARWGWSGRDTQRSGRARPSCRG